MARTNVYPSDAGSMLPGRWLSEEASAAFLARAGTGRDRSAFTRLLGTQAPRLRMGRSVAGRCATRLLAVSGSPRNQRTKS